MNSLDLERSFALGYENFSHGRTIAVYADCFDWLAQVEESSIHAVVTDPPYGIKEYEHGQIVKRGAGRGGIWRIPPSFDGSNRAPLPRFTALNAKERVILEDFFRDWSRLVLRVLRPGGHVIIASNAFLSQPVFAAIVEGGLEFRGEVIRLVQTFRGGDRPKNAHEEFADVVSMPRGGYEPWGLFRKPMPGKMKVSDCLRDFQTGGLRRRPDGGPFSDVILAGRTPKAERNLADHPSLKPQSILRQLVYASLPLGEGVVLDPFMGSGSTLAAAEAIGYQCIGIERHPDYFRLAKDAIPALSTIKAEMYRGVSRTTTTTPELSSQNLPSSDEILGLWD